MTAMLRRSGGQRQRIWNALLSANEPLSVEEIVSMAGGNGSSVRTYLNGLAKHGYTVNRLGWALLKKTGRTAPAYSIQTGELRDWNVDRAMTPKALERAFKKHGGNLTEFCRDIGIHENSVTRLRQMLAGMRPVTGNVEAAVNAWGVSLGQDKSSGTP